MSNINQDADCVSGWKEIMQKVCKEGRDGHDAVLAARLIRDLLYCGPEGPSKMYMPSLMIQGVFFRRLEDVRYQGRSGMGPSGKTSEIGSWLIVAPEKREKDNISSAISKDYFYRDGIPVPTGDLQTIFNDILESSNTKDLEHSIFPTIKYIQKACTMADIDEKMRDSRECMMKFLGKDVQESNEQLWDIMCSNCLGSNKKTNVNHLKPGRTTLKGLDYTVVMDACYGDFRIKSFQNYLLLICASLAKNIGTVSLGRHSRIMTPHQVSQCLMYQWFYRAGSRGKDRSIWGEPESCSMDTIDKAMTIFKKGLLDGCRQYVREEDDSVSSFVDLCSDKRRFLERYIECCDTMRQYSEYCSAVIMNRFTNLDFQDLDKDALLKHVSESFMKDDKDSEFSTLTDSLLRNAEKTAVQFSIDSQTPKRRNASRAMQLYETMTLSMDRAVSKIVGWMGPIGYILIDNDGWFDKRGVDILWIRKPYHEVQSNLDVVYKEICKMGKECPDFETEVEINPRSVLAYPFGISNTAIFFSKDYQEIYRAVLFQLYVKGGCQGGWGCYRKDVPLYPTALKMLQGVVDKLTHATADVVMHMHCKDQKKYLKTHCLELIDNMQMVYESMYKTACLMTLSFKERVMLIAAVRTVCWLFVPNNSPSKIYKPKRWEAIDVDTYMGCLISLIQIHADPKFAEKDYSTWNENLKWNAKHSEGKKARNVSSELIRATVMNSSMFRVDRVGVKLLCMSLKEPCESPAIEYQSRLISLMHKDLTNPEWKDINVVQEESGSMLFRQGTPLADCLLEWLQGPWFPAEYRLSILTRLSLVVPNNVNDKKFCKFTGIKEHGLYFARFLSSEEDQRPEDTNHSMQIFHGHFKEYPELNILKSGDVLRMFKKKGGRKDGKGLSSSHDDVSNGEEEQEESEDAKLNDLVQEFEDFIVAEDDQETVINEDNGEGTSCDHEEEDDDEMDILDILKDHSESRKKERRGTLKRKREDGQDMGKMMDDVICKLENHPNVKRIKAETLRQRPEEKSFCLLNFVRSEINNRLARTFRMLEKCAFKKDREKALSDGFDISGTDICNMKDVPCSVDYGTSLEDRTVITYDKSLAMSRFHSVYKRMTHNVQDTSLMDMISFWGMRRLQDFCQ